MNTIVRAILFTIINIFLSGLIGYTIGIFIVGEYYKLLYIFPFLAISPLLLLIINELYDGELFE